MRRAAIVLVLVVAFSAGTVYVGTQLLLEKAGVAEPPITPFPVGVDPARKMIVESAEADAYFARYVEKDSPAENPRTGWIWQLLSKLALNPVYQNIASPGGRILVILPGERREEVAEHFGKILGWDRDERREFMALVASTTPELIEGKFSPHTYTAVRGASPGEAAALVIERFEKDTLARYPSETAEIVPLAGALTIASLLEREGRDFEDMRHISGIIWNRLFADMKLQLDATLQYAKGSRSDHPWWPRVVPADKQIASAYNTYKHEGLPPAPIANPSLDAMIAALNPKATDCMFYFHDKDEGFHCTKTYEEHVALLKQYYGRGK